MVHILFGAMDTSSKPGETGVVVVWIVFTIYIYIYMYRFCWVKRPLPTTMAVRVTTQAIRKDPPATTTNEVATMAHSDPI